MGLPTVAPTTDTQAQAPETMLDWSLGWRYETVHTADGKEVVVRVPLTPDEALHPEEGYVMPVRTAHDRIADDLADMLRAFYESQPDVAVFHDLVFEWDQPEIRPYAPDIAVIPNVRDREADRGQFVVAAEGTRPLLIVEVVSPKTRQADRVTKVRDYALLGVQEYVYIDHWTRKRQEVWEIAGFRLHDDRYLPIVPDEDGAVYCETIGMRIGIAEGEVWLEVAATGQELLTNLKARRALREADEARQAAEARAAELEAQLQALLRQQQAGEAPDKDE